MAEHRAPQYLASYEHLFDPDPRGTTLFRLGLLAAMIVHAAVFAITWPGLVHDEIAPSYEVTVRPFQMVKFLPPPPIEQNFTLPPRRVPVPDPSPFDPEPITETSPAAPVPKSSEDLVRFIPDPPPMPEEIDTPSVVEAGIDIDPPQVLHRVEPIYTSAANRIRYEGAVVLSLLIDTDGRVTDVAVLQEQPFGLTESAVAAARQWRFEPCTFDGRPVSVRYTLTVRFKTTK